MQSVGQAQAVRDFVDPAKIPLSLLKLQQKTLLARQWKME
jgi:hypothetical protein